MERLFVLCLTIATAFAQVHLDCNGSKPCSQNVEDSEDDAVLENLEENSWEAVVEDSLEQVAKVMNYDPRRRYIPWYPRRRYIPSLSRRRYVPSGYSSHGSSSQGAIVPIVIVSAAVLVALLLYCACNADNQDQGDAVEYSQPRQQRPVYKDGQPQRNDDGANTYYGSQVGFTSTVYCGRFLGRHVISGSDGQCGPNNGPQCASCGRMQKCLQEPDVSHGIPPGVIVAQVIPDGTDPMGHQVSPNSAQALMGTPLVATPV